MFGNIAMVKDEFREILKLVLDFDETTGSVKQEKLAYVSTLAGVNQTLTFAWVQGMARPVPHEERAILAMLKAIDLHTHTEVVQSDEQEGNLEPK